MKPRSDAMPAPRDPGQSLVGGWEISSDESEIIASLGEVGFRFFPGGRMIYYTGGQNGEYRISYLVYRLESGVIVTDQPSHPDEGEQPYRFAPHGRLELWFEGRWVSFHRVEPPAWTNRVGEVGPPQ
jgi:hypothetical protein